MKAIEFFFFFLNNLKPLTATPLHSPSDFDEAIQRRKGSAIAVMIYITPKGQNCLNALT